MSDAADAVSSLLPIVQAGHPALRQIAAGLNDKQLRDPSLGSLLTAMRETMYAAPGVGLAAPQVGISMRLAVIEDREAYLAHVPEEKLADLERRTVPFTVLVNPVVERVDDETVLAFEGCLSVDGFRALVPRHRRIRLRWTNLDGSSADELWTGWAARIAQHECDHLDGMIYIDRMLPRSFMTHAEWYHRWQDLAVEEVCAALDIPSR